MQDKDGLVREKSWRKEIGTALNSTFAYWLTLYEVLICDRKYSELSFLPEDRWARVQVYSLALIFRMFKRPHYRSKSFQQDMLDNLRNVAVPGTGLPLSLFCYSKFTVLLFVVLINPLICLLGAVNKCRKIPNLTLEKFVCEICRAYVSHLLHPQDWFSFWRLNCRLVSYHSMITRAPGYRQEDKWTFLVEGHAAGVPVSPFLTCESLVCKNKNIEGGLGIFFYRNAAHGGDWIIQEKLKNACWLEELLPRDAPLSTMRVITTSTWALGRCGRDTGEAATLTGSNSNGASVVGGSCSPSTSRTMPTVSSTKGVLVAPISPVSSLLSPSPTPLSTSPLSSSVAAADLDIDHEIDHGQDNQDNCDREGKCGEKGESDGDDGDKGSVWVDSPLSVDGSAKPRTVTDDCTLVKSSTTLSSSVYASNLKKPVLSGNSTSRSIGTHAADFVTPRCAVLRLGRAGAATDHSSILFDVDLTTGVIRDGYTNAHWYQIGPWRSLWGCPWLPEANVQRHSDCAPNASPVTGKIVPDMEAALKIVTESHFKLMPDVPIVGWDVAFTPQGIYLLEVRCDLIGPVTSIFFFFYYFSTLTVNPPADTPGEPQLQFLPREIRH